MLILRSGPGSYIYPDERMRFSYITDVLETLILRDIRQKYRIRNAELGTKKLDPLRRIRDAYPKIGRAHV